VLALQTMLFVKGPGSPGQGWHQDSYYIPTYPDSLAAAWMPLERVDEENGCLYVTPGTQHEPVFPDADDRPGYGGDPALADIKGLYGASADDEAVNGLTPVVRRYAGGEVPLVMDPGDVAFFGGHLLHRSLRNRSATRSRRAFVSHYCNARSFVAWHDDWSEPRVDGEGYNRKHILARGSTHLPYAQPRFGTACAANQPAHERPPRRRPTSIMGSPDGLMAPAEHGEPGRED
jgi:ectoine hydroxylase-related dioxygenase (phytanoyl-CoA dioxygenase family)